MESIGNFSDQIDSAASFNTTIDLDESINKKDLIEHPFSSPKENTAVSLEDLSFSYSGDENKILNGISKLWLIAVF